MGPGPGVQFSCWAEVWTYLTAIDLYTGQGLMSGVRPLVSKKTRKTGMEGFLTSGNRADNHEACMTPEVVAFHICRFCIDYKL